MVSLTGTIGTESATPRGRKNQWSGRGDLFVQMFFLKGKHKENQGKTQILVWACCLGD